MIAIIWIKLGHKGFRKTLVGMVYREHIPWKTKKAALNIKSVDRKRRDLHDGRSKP